MRASGAHVRARARAALRSRSSDAGEHPAARDRHLGAQDGAGLRLADEQASPVRAAVSHVGRVSILITDDGTDSAVLDRLRETGIEVVVVTPDPP